MQTPSSPPRGRLVLPLVLSAALLAACSVAPTYQRPDAAVGVAYKESIPPAESAAWKLAEPADGGDRGRWWTAFGDPVLDRLVDEAAAANPSLKIGFARLQQSRAIARAVDADRAPQVGVGAGATRSRPSPASLGLPADADVTPRTVWRAQLSASYEVDLFSRLASASAAALAEAERDEGLYRSLQLAIQADVAQTWFALRGVQAEIALLDGTVGLREQALALLERRLTVGEIAELDVARARTELATTRAERVALQRRRADLEHALAVLLGKAPSELSVPQAPLQFAPLHIPAGLPSALLERRPDIAAAERSMAAANARIGVARAAWFPRLTLTGLLGLESAESGDLLRRASRTWALGPLAGTALSMTLFDGGRRRADEAAAMAAFDEAAAGYRLTVLGALREVEDGIAAVRSLAQQAAEFAQARQSAQRAAELSMRRYRAGHVSHLEVIDAERQVLAAQRSLAQAERERALAAVALVRALGGAWDASAPVATAVAGSP